MNSVRTVHVVFKTHLDIGFTELARDVRRAYLDDFIPGAIRLARELEASGGPERFVWTTGAWLVEDYLRSVGPEARADMDRAIRDGHVAWHALPFTTHSEMMDASLFEHGLSIAARLDATYDRSTIAAKMTDVPGHTIGIVPLLSAAGVRYLHIGTNPSSATPEVPAAFLWRAPDGSEIVVNYAAAYGSDAAEVFEAPGSDQALYVSMTNDNHGPPSAQRVKEIFAGLADRYPDAEIRGGRLDDFAAALWAARDQLPLLTSEIGDSWIHGIASDPTQVRNFRELQRLRDGWLDNGELVPGTAEHDAFSSRLLMVPEHTWGKDLKRFLPDYVNYRKPEFAAARARDAVDPGANPPEMAAYVAQARPPGTGLSYSGYEESWAEQRTYLDQAIDVLSPERKRLARRSLRELAVPPVEPVGRSISPAEQYHLGCFDVRFAGDGSIVSLVGEDGRPRADADHRLAAYTYVTYDTADYERWFEQYHENMAENGVWAIPDFGKPGMESASPAHQSFSPRIGSMSWHLGETADVVTIRLRMPDEASQVHGAPRGLVVRYSFDRSEAAVDIHLGWFGKDAYRLPEASWLTITPLVQDPDAWRIDKLGTRVDPRGVVVGGNRSLHAVGSGLHYGGPDGSVEVITSDAAVVAAGAHRLLTFDNAIPDLTEGFQVNLHNNVWGTNFRMWFGEDAAFRFRLSFEVSASGTSAS